MRGQLTGVLESSGRNALRRCASVAFFVIGASVAAAQTPVLHEDFESGAPGWVMTGYCHIEADSTTCGALVAPFPSPGHCIWFGVPANCDYDVPFGGGTLDPPNPISLPAGAQHLMLRYRRFQETEHCVDGYDVSWLEVKTAGGLFQLLSTGDCSNLPGWTDRRIDLSAWAGTQVDIHMGFNPGDNMYNDTLGWWIDDFEIVEEPGAASCTATSACPCPQGPYSLPPSGGPDIGGCKNSSGRRSLLFASGTAQVSADTVELAVRGLPPSTTLIYAQGNAQPTVVFGDGLRCVGGTVVRLAIHGVTGGQDTYPHTGETGIAQKGAVPALGGSRTYQVVYRDAASYCTSSTFNTSNGYVIAWVP